MDIQDVLDLMKHAADTAILPRWRGLGESEVEEKAPGKLVTVADHESEQIILDGLAAHYPDALLLAEEAAYKDPSLLDKFYSAEHSFTIDPVDGTRNFVNGSADFAVMVSELRLGEVVRAWIWQPAHKVSFTAERGAGAYRNSKQLKVLQPDDDISAWRGVTSRNGLKKNTYGPLSRLHSAWWCCGVDYPSIAMGRADYIVYVNVWPWDHAPGSLLLHEVGGQSIRKSGRLYEPSKQVEPWLIAGANGIPQQVLPHFSEDLPGA